MKGRKILLAFIISAVTLTSGCANGTPKTEEAKSEQKTTEENAVVPIKPLTAKAIDDNPYMAKSDANIHHDCYNSDTTDEVLPVDIYPEINVSYEKVNQNACQDNADLRLSKKGYEIGLISQERYDWVCQK